MHARGWWQRWCPRRWTGSERTNAWCRCRPGIHPVRTAGRNACAEREPAQISRANLARSWLLRRCCRCREAHVRPSARASAAGRHVYILLGGMFFLFFSFLFFFLFFSFLFYFYFIFSFLFFFFFLFRALFIFYFCFMWFLC